MVTSCFWHGDINKKLSCLLLNLKVSLPPYIFFSSIAVVFQHLAIKTDQDMMRRSTPPAMETSLMLQLSWKKTSFFKKIHFQLIQDLTLVNLGR